MGTRGIVQEGGERPRENWRVLNIMIAILKCGTVKIIEGASK